MNFCSLLSILSLFLKSCYRGSRIFRSEWETLDRDCSLRRNSAIIYLWRTMHSNNLPSCCSPPHYFLFCSQRSLDPQEGVEGRADPRCELFPFMANLNLRMKKNVQWTAHLKPFYHLGILLQAEISAEALNIKTMYVPLNSTQMEDVTNCT